MRDQIRQQANPPTGGQQTIQINQNSLQIKTRFFYLATINVELCGIEPQTSALQGRRSPS